MAKAKESVVVRGGYSTLTKPSIQGANGRSTLGSRGYSLGLVSLAGSTELVVLAEFIEPAELARLVGLATSIEFVETLVVIGTEHQDQQLWGLEEDPIK
uniref:Uncharacterized protein n=1 Tax=Cannabis sativa TaxID=3483 RepID=A0A803PYX1_CANSA